MRCSNYRPITKIPHTVVVMVLITLTMQLTWHRYTVVSDITRQELPVAPKVQWFQVLALGEVEVSSRLNMLWLQAFDNQPGVSLPLHTLDYVRLTQWLQLIQDMDSRSQYAMFSAAYIYSVIANREKQELVFEFIVHNFKLQPNKRWRWLAHAAIMAQHRMHDNDLALRYARLLRQYAIGPDVPAWVQQLEIGILEAKGEFASAQLLIGGLLNEDKIKDPHELAFLNARLQSLKAAAAK